MESSWYISQFVPIFFGAMVIFPNEFGMPNFQQRRDKASDLFVALVPDAWAKRGISRGTKTKM